MITKIHLQNFRSISQASPELGKITVLTGANNSGKSSILYGLMILQDFLRNPNRTLEDLFALPFINLGGFADVKSKYDTASGEPEHISIGVSVSSKVAMASQQVRYKLALQPGRAWISLQSEEGPCRFKLSRDIGLPFVPKTALSGNIDVQLADQSLITALYLWNGISAEPLQMAASNVDAEEITQALNSPNLALAATDFVPISRGFTKPYYSLVPMRGIIQTEEEVATMLKSAPETLLQVNAYLKEIAEREIELPSNSAPSLFSLLAKNTRSGQTNFLVNEGSGTNQVVTMLAKTFQPGKRLICIDEPEIHLHPSMVRKLAGAFAAMIKDEPDRQFLVSTHSEHFVRALLEKVALGEIQPDEVKVYHLYMTEQGTAIEHHKINAKGQLEGGLSHFFAEELEGLSNIFKLSD